MNIVVIERGVESNGDAARAEIDPSYMTLSALAVMARGRRRPTLQLHSTLYMWVMVLASTQVV